jgi:hypothetical protein
MENQKVNGYSNLKRDGETNSIINTNVSEYNQYISLRKNKQLKNKKIENEIDEMKNEISEIKMLLKELLKSS